jgi:hypothetical protein
METNENQPQTALDLDGAYVLKGNALQIRTTEPRKPPVERKFKNDKDFKEVVMNSGKLLFGENTLLLNMGKAGENFPEGFLFDLSDIEKPKLYFLDIRLSGENFFTDLFPRVTKYLILCKDQDFVRVFVETVRKNIGLRNKLDKAIGGRDVLAFITSAFSNKPCILLVSDSESPELPTIRLVYPDTWSILVKLVLIRKFQSNGDVVCMMTPSFAEIRNDKAVKRKRETGIEYSEDFHLQKTSEMVKGIYAKIRTELLKADNALVFHAQKYYISVGTPKSFIFRFTRKKITIVVMLSDKDTRKEIKHHVVKTLKDSVQKFWNGDRPCCEMVIENEDKLNEVIAFMKKLIKR